MNVPEPSPQDLKHDPYSDYAGRNPRRYVDGLVLCDLDVRQAWIRRTVAAERERDEARKRQREDEQQLVEIATYIGKDARGVTGDGPHTIATLVQQEMDDLRRQLADHVCDKHRILGEYDELVISLRRQLAEATERSR